MARGIDAIAHQGAWLSTPRRRRAGTGVGVCYPKENKKLYEKVPERGAIISEFPLGTHPAPKISRFGTASSPDCPWVLSS
jgi:DNA processing protein